MYLDANNIYGWAMSQYLPTGGFKWFKRDEINEIELFMRKKNSEKGLILEVDFEYPQDLHDNHNDYPLAAEKMNVDESMLSKYCEQMRNKYGMTIDQVKKIIPNLNNNKNMCFIIEIFNRISNSDKK